MEDTQSSSSSACNPLDCMVRNFKKGFGSDFGYKLSPKALKRFCQIHWPIIVKDSPSQGTFQVEMIQKVYVEVTSDPRFPE